MWLHREIRLQSDLLGPSLTLPIRDGRVALGTWQGIYLCEHRNHGGPRLVVATAWGEGGRPDGPPNS